MFLLSAKGKVRGSVKPIAFNLKAPRPDPQRKAKQGAGANVHELKHLKPHTLTWNSDPETLIPKL